MKLELQALNNVERSSNPLYQWTATSGDPQFAIVGWEHMRGRTARFTFRLVTDGLPKTPCMLYLDKGKGLSEQGAVWMHTGTNGDLVQEVSFPYSLAGVRFDPLACPGFFSLEGFSLEVLEDSRPFGEPGDAPAEELEPTYENWITLNEPSADDYTALACKADQWERKPLFSIVMPTYNSRPEFLREAIDSVLAQVYPNWELCIADDNSSEPGVRAVLDEYAARDPRIKVTYRSENGHISAASNSALALATGEYTGLLDHDDLLHPLALYFVGDLIQRHPEAALIYSDEDKVDLEGKRFGPYFKCDFNYDLFLGQNMICHFGVYKTSMLGKIGGFREGFEGAQDYDLALRVLDASSHAAIFHIPRVLYHWRMLPESTATSVDAKPYALTAASRAIEAHLERRGIEATVQAADQAPIFQRIAYALPKSLPQVEIIVPTRDGAALVKQCVDSITTRTIYDNYLVTIIDNGSEKHETFELFASYAGDPRIRVVRDDSPFNYSALNNRVALASQADFVCLLNNDIEVITPEWLGELVSIALQDNVGAVGAKLLYPDDTVQHAGVIVGIGGIAGHAYKHVERHDPGYFSRALLRNTLSAVTAACLLIRTSIYREVGGLDEKLVVAFNDVDFCLRVREAGYRNVWTPFAELYHHESASRGYEDTPEKIARFGSEMEFVRDRWGDALLCDPFYSPNLTLDTTDFALTMSPRITK